jgi:hypothetical protein
LRTTVFGSALARTKNSEATDSESCLPLPGLLFEFLVSLLFCLLAWLRSVFAGEEFLGPDGKQLMADHVGDLGADFVFLARRGAYFKLGGESIRLTVSLPSALTRNHIGDISRM